MEEVRGEQLHDDDERNTESFFLCVGTSTLLPPVRCAIQFAQTPRPLPATFKRHPSARAEDA